MCEPIRVEVTQKREKPSLLADLLTAVAVGVLALAFVVPPPEKF